MRKFKLVLSIILIVVLGIATGYGLVRLGKHLGAELIILKEVFTCYFAPTIMYLYIFVLYKLK